MIRRSHALGNGCLPLLFVFGVRSCVLTFAKDQDRTICMAPVSITKGFKKWGTDLRLFLVRITPTRNSLGRLGLHYSTIIVISKRVDGLSRDAWKSHVTISSLATWLFSSSASRGEAQGNISPRSAHRRGRPRRRRDSSTPRRSRGKSGPGPRCRTPRKKRRRACPRSPSWGTNSSSRCAPTPSARSFSGMARRSRACATVTATSAARHSFRSSGVCSR